MSVSFHLLFLFVAVVLCDEEEAKLRYYYSSVDNYTELALHEAQGIFSTSWYDPSKTTVIFSHGFSGKPQGPAVTAVINAYLEQGGSNVALLNWKELAAPVLPSMANSYLNWAAPNARKLGANFANTLLNLSTAGLNLHKTVLVGHSLGAHVVGIAGNRLFEKGIQLPWIIGLDPASIGFENKPLPNRLHQGSAGFVSVIHSDPSRYGYKGSLGTVDFWPNYRNAGAVTQPGCDSRGHTTFSPEDLCNHNRSWQILIDSLKYPGTLIGSYAPTFRKWKRYSKEQREAKTLDIGVCQENAQPGNYYFTTNEKSPYGLGKDGL